MAISVGRVDGLTGLLVNACLLGQRLVLAFGLDDLRVGQDVPDLLDLPCCCPEEIPEDIAQRLQGCAVTLDGRGGRAVASGCLRGRRIRLGRLVVGSRAERL